jgi:hypothetical protein
MIPGFGVLFFINLKLRLGMNESMVASMEKNIMHYYDMVLLEGIIYIFLGLLCIYAAYKISKSYPSIMLKGFALVFASWGLIDVILGIIDVSKAPTHKKEVLTHFPSGLDFLKNTEFTGLALKAWWLNIHIGIVVVLFLIGLYLIMMNNRMTYLHGIGLGIITHAILYLFTFYYSFGRLEFYRFTLLSYITGDPDATL